MSCVAEDDVNIVAVAGSVDETTRGVVAKSPVKGSESDEVDTTSIAVLGSGGALKVVSDATITVAVELEITAEDADDGAALVKTTLSVAMSVELEVV